MTFNFVSVIYISMKCLLCGCIFIMKFSASFLCFKMISFALYRSLRWLQCFYLLSSKAPVTSSLTIYRCSLTIRTFSATIEKLEHGRNQKTKMGFKGHECRCHWRNQNWMSYAIVEELAEFGATVHTLSRNQSST